MIDGHRHSLQLLLLLMLSSDFEMKVQLTVDICDFVEEANEAVFLDMAFDHQVLANQVQLGHSLSYSVQRIARDRV